MKETKAKRIQRKRRNKRLLKRIQRYDRTVKICLWILFPLLIGMVIWIWLIVPFLIVFAILLINGGKLSKIKKQQVK